MSTNIQGERMEDEQHLLSGRSSKGPSASCKLIVALAILIPTALLLAALAAIAVLSVRITHLQATSSSNSQTNVCTSPSCIKLASNVLQFMNTSVDPCQDFYNYSCGGWEAANVIPSGYGSWGLFNELNQRNNIAIKKLLDGMKLSDVDAVKLARKLYESCMDTDGLTAKGAEPIRNLLSLTGGWDLVGVMNSSAPQWSLFSADFRSSKSYGNDGFFSFGISVNDKNSSQYIPVLSQSGLTLPSPDSYTDPSAANVTIPALKQFIVSILSLINNTNGGTGAAAAGSGFEQVADQIIDLETSLAEIFVSNVALRDPQATYNLYNLTELANSTLWTQFNWTQYILESFKAAQLGDIGSDDIVINVRTPSYFKNLSLVYINYNESVLENYFKWHLVLQYIEYLGNQFLSPYYQYTTSVLGSGKTERYLTCVSSLEDIVPMTVSRLYTDYVLAPGTKGNISEMVSQIKTAFQERLSKNTFLDSVTKQRSIWKVGNISQMIAYPDEISDNNYLLNKSASVVQASGQYFMSAVNHVINGNTENLQKLGKPVVKTEWEIAPTVVNAYYEPLYNEFVFLEGILNSPFFDAGWPDYFKYGAFGVVAGHELTHGFDDQGQQYNQDGVLTPWWTNTSVAKFKNKTKCFVEQYSQYSMFGYHINGELTQGENIADNGGVKTAFQAYKNVAGTTTPPSLPSVDLNPDQLFFVAFGQVWCSLFSPQFIASNLKTNPHSPGPYRVIGALSNSEEFSSTFKCADNTRMNPSKKCDLW
uniref:Endothelin-converting enzyme 1 n=2 Tax=Amphimedon queenslandica TaxID=400682 RepID=A0A1X7TUR9_AMPQE